MVRQSIMRRHRPTILAPHRSTTVAARMIAVAMRPVDIVAARPVGIVAAILGATQMVAAVAAGIPKHSRQCGHLQERNAKYR